MEQKSENLDTFAVFLHDYYNLNKPFQETCWDIENEIQSAVLRDAKRIIIDFKAIAEFDEKYGTKLEEQLLSLKDEELQKLLKTFEDEINNIDRITKAHMMGELNNPNLTKEDLERIQKENRLKLGIKNLPKTLTIADILEEKHQGKLIQVEGIIQNIGIPFRFSRKKVLSCDRCGFEIIKIFEINERKMINKLFCPSCRTERTFKEEKEKEITLKTQLLTIVEGVAMSSSMPISLLVVLFEDLLDNPNPEKRKFIAGSKIRVVGMLKEMKTLSPVKKIYIESLWWEVEAEEIKFTDADIKKFKRLAKDEKLIPKLTTSFCPSIYGYEDVKLGLLLQIVGGVTQVFEADKKFKRGNIHVLLIGDPSCLSEDSYVVMSDGTMKKISRFGMNHLESINAEILSEDKTAMAVRFHKFNNQPIYEVMTQSGKSINGTQNHPLMTKNGWKRIDELNMQDEIKTTTNTKCKKEDLVGLDWDFYKSGDSIEHSKKRRMELIIPKFFDDNLAKIIGFLPDGHIKKNKYSIEFFVQKNESEKIEIFKKLFKETFNFNHIKIKNDSGYWKGKPYSFTIMSIYSSNITKWILSLFSDKKRTPEIIFQSRDSVVSSYLSAVFDSNGSVYKYFDKKQQVRKNFISLRSNNLPFLRDIQLLLLRFGICGRINDDINFGNENIKLEIPKKTYKLLIRRVEDVRSFYKNIGFVSERKKKTLEDVILHSDNKNSQKKSEWEKIKSINFVGLGTVYDIEVPETHSFISNGIISHNTAKTSLSLFVFNYLPNCKLSVCSETTSAGLGVAMLKDKETESWYLSAGVLPLARNSVAILDEIDKATGDDIKSLDTVMSLQKLPVSKAGINITLPAETSVLAIANPKGSRWDDMRDLKEQVNLSEVNLSRYDLKFCFKDKPNQDLDGKITNIMINPESVKTPLTSEFLIKYLIYAKRFKPKLSNTTADKLKKFYIEMRQRTAEKSGILVITSRQFEGLIRFAEAFAKIRLADKTNEKDADNSIECFKGFLRSFGFDYETGEIDIDKAEGRTSARGRDETRIILDVYNELKLIFIEKVPKEDMLERMGEEGIRNPDKILTKAIREGVFIEPEIGVIRKV